MIKLAPSVLSADFGRLGEQVREAEAAGADYVHVDVMDGHFVPNITVGPIVLEWLRPMTRQPIDVHLMISDADRYIPLFAAAGADLLTVHVEACPHLHRTIQLIHDHGVKAGVALNPATPVMMLEEILPFVDLVLVMTVNPGFGGQRFIDGLLDKVARVRQMLDARHLQAELEVDGGIVPENAGKLVRAGARVLVAGSAVFNRHTSVEQAVRALRESTTAALAV